ncbi:MAG: UDP-N-acetylmuramate dehydrogenase, partial [Acidimicrobiia bacterium]|nr:UDP-N-acetylmuramate dehydrogenase [Acidimicrobiia bacterium]
MIATLDDLVARGLVAENVVLGSLTTYKFGGPARYFAEATSEADLVELGLALGDESIVVIGRGSNLVIADRGFDGVAVRLGSGLAQIEVGDDGQIRAGGAASLPQLARTSAKAGRGGLEWCVGVPGSVGGAVRMNAGCHGSETSQWLVEASVVNLRGGDVTTRTPQELDLSYRHSNLRSDEIVTGTVFRTVESTITDAEAEIRRITAWRKEHQPGGTLNAGSVFKNPPGDFAGRLIDSLGFKGLEVGGASVSDRHANFFV